MRVRGSDLWPAALTRDLVTETHYGRALRCYPGRPQTLGEVLDRAAERVPDRDAIVAPDRRLTWRQLRAEVDRLASALHARHGVKPGDRVALLFLNSAEFCVGVFACARLGAVAVTLNTKLKAPELEFMLRHSGARLLLMHDTVWSEIAPIRASIPCEAIYVSGHVPAGTAGLESLTDPAAPPAVAVSEEDVAFIMYTSGTTGRPKGAMGTHLGILSSNVSLERCMGLRDGDRTLVAAPLFHVTGLIGQLLSMAFVGGTTVIMRTFDAAEALRLLDAERVTYMIAAPTVFTMMRQQPNYRAAGRSLRAVGYGGAPTPPDGVIALREWLPTATLQNAYGMTETCSPTTLSPPGEELRRISSVGWPVPIADLRTVEVGTGRECAAGEVGELWVSGPMVVPGYWANPEATAAAMGDGWLRTGDLAKIDADGYVTVMDRLKDLINRGGEKIYCVEVEDVLCSHAGVLEAAVVGVPDAVYGEAVKACVVARAGATVDPEELRRWVGARLAKFKVPREVAVLDALPRNPNGKVIKSALR
jgi:acyl-CoA synthetase (AMP-forming)/AMP-acid ligase II